MLEKDAELLRIAEGAGWSLVTLDRSTMPVHIQDHLAAGHHTNGVFILRSGFPIRALANDLLLIWSCSEVAEWRDQLTYLPWNAPGLS